MDPMFVYLTIQAIHPFVVNNFEVHMILVVETNNKPIVFGKRGVTVVVM